MSTKRYRQMVEDRNLRDAALALVKADVEHLRSDMSAKSIGERVVDRASDGALDVFEEAAEAADNNRGILATLLAAVVIWFARNPIMSLLSDEEDGEEYGDEDDDDDELTEEQVEAEDELRELENPAGPQAG